MKQEQRTVSDQLKNGPFLLDLKTQRVYKAGKQLKLAAREFQMLKLFMERPNEPITRDDLFK